MTDFRQILNEADHEVDFMIRHCTKDEYLFLAQLRAMQWNLRRMKDLIDMRDKIVSYVRSNKRQTRSK